MQNRPSANHKERRYVATQTNVFGTKDVLISLPSWCAIDIINNLSSSSENYIFPSFAVVVAFFEVFESPSHFIDTAQTTSPTQDVILVAVSDSRARACFHTTRLYASENCIFFMRFDRRWFCSRQKPS